MDNLSLDQHTGDIYAAAFPKVSEVMKGFDAPIGFAAPSTAIRVRKLDGQLKWEWEKTIEDGDGAVMPVSTTVIRDGKTGRLFMSGEFVLFYFSSFVVSRPISFLLYALASFCTSGISSGCILVRILSLAFKNCMTHDAPMRGSLCRCVRMHVKCDVPKVFEGARQLLPPVIGSHSPASQAKESTHHAALLA